ncbi:potassium channel family protein [Salinivirga cyanobacteriivorans]
MFRTFDHFNVKTVDKPYISALGTQYEQTAIISFYDSANHLLSTRDFGVANIDKIYNEIEQERIIVLDEAYIQNFSITAWRRLNLIDKNEFVAIKKIIANDAFFNVFNNVDFSYIALEACETNFNNSVFYGGDLSFSHSVFSGVEADFSYITHRKGGLVFNSAKFTGGGLSFKNSIFCHGEKNFQYAKFEHSYLDFTNCEFNDGDINMVDTRFTGGLSFKVARIGKGNVNFQFARFTTKEVSFDRVVFGEGNIDFRTTEFENVKANFNRSIAGNGSWDFSGCEANDGKLTFKKVLFGSGTVDFSEVIFNRTDLNFSRAETQEALIKLENARLHNVDFSYCFFNRYLNFRLHSAQRIDFKNAIVRDILDLNLPKEGQPVPMLNFTDMSLPGLLYIDWKRNRVEQAVYNQNSLTTDYEKATQFLMLKENFNTNGQYESEDLAYVEYRRCIARSRLNNKGGGINQKVLRGFLYGLDRVLLDYTGLYGTSPTRVFATMIMVYVLFSLGYLAIILGGSGDIVVSVGAQYDLSLWSKSFYHSAITMLTIGYGDHFPVGIARGLSAVQGFIGMLLLSYFTVSLVHKILR